ncbi:MAG TPA: NUDIX hydrolase [Thermodesulfobacteriota bacterium]|nr:NUDIX hydrolase [Thermodesulfobacteriota bacterium]
MSRPWSFLHSKILYACRIFQLRNDVYRSPRTGIAHDFSILESSDWVNVVPLTADGKIVLVKQYRIGTREFSLEIPGGMLDKGDDPPGAAVRELMEETGCAGDPPVLLGVVHPNPAILTNRCYTYLIRNVAFKAPPRQDSTEDIEVQTVPLSEVPVLIREGKITHALVIAAFYWYFNQGA